MSSHDDSLRDLWDDLTEYGQLSSDLFDTYIGVASQQLNRETWGRNYRVGVILLAAHMRKLFERANQNISVSGGTAGAVSSISEGDQSLSFENAVAQVSQNVADASLSGTSYGTQYLRLREQTIGGPYMQGS